MILHLHQKLKISWHFIGQPMTISGLWVILTWLDNLNFNELVEDHELSALISEPTCFKSNNPTSIDNFLISQKARFMNTLTSETGVTDHHKLIGAMLRSTFAKGKF